LSIGHFQEALNAHLFYPSLFTPFTVLKEQLMVYKNEKIIASLLNLMIILKKQVDDKKI